jgi:hypothetical protein
MSNTAKQNILNIDEATLKMDEALRRVTLNKLNIDTPEFFHLIKKQESPAEQIQEARKVIEIGSFVKSKVEMVMDTDFIESRVKDMTHGFNTQMQFIQKEMIQEVDKNFDPAQAESYTARMNRFFQEKSKEFQETAEKAVGELINQNKKVSEKIDGSFDPDSKSSYMGQLITFVDDFKKGIEKRFDVKQAGSLTHDLKQMLIEQFGEDGKLLQSVEKRFSLDSSDSFASQVFKKLEEIKQEVKATKSAAEAEEVIIQSTPKKGFVFEDILENALESIAASRGDIVENLSTTSGEVTRSKKGDFNYTLKSINKKIAIEAKSTPMKTPKSVLEHIKITKENRSADYVIYLTEHEEQLHKQVGLFQEYEDDKLVTHFGLLEVALKVAVSRLMLENSEIEGIDRGEVESEITAITNSIKNFRGITVAANNIRKEADKILLQSSSINDEITTAVGNLNTIILNN